LYSIFDLHVHTREGSIDSALSPEEFIGEAQRLGLTGAVFSEHDGWQRHRFNEFVKQREGDGVVLIHALEVYTDMGHVLVYGLDGYRPGIRNIEELRKVVDEVGGYMILAHPFRFFYGPHGNFTRNVLFEDPKAMPQNAEEAACHPVFQLVDEIEVVNGGNDRPENCLALQVAAIRGKPGTGGSDAHSNNGIGLGSTLFHGEIRHERDLREALRAGAYTPVEGFNKGKIIYYGEPPATVIAEEGVLSSPRIQSVHVQPENGDEPREEP
jgi:hypothetical protein